MNVTDFDLYDTYVMKTYGSYAKGYQRLSAQAIDPRISKEGTDTDQLLHYLDHLACIM